MSNNVLKPVGSIDPANKDLIDDDAYLVDTGDDELYVVQLPEVDDGQ